MYVSLLALFNGDWKGKWVLDGKEVSFISSYFDDTSDAGDPTPLKENKDRMYQGSIFLGDGFLLNYAEAEKIIEDEPRCREVIFPVMNGQDLNSSPTQAPGRNIINFGNKSIEEAEEYAVPFNRIDALVRPGRVKGGNTEKWWQFWRPRIELYTALRGLVRCFVAARTTKHLNFSAAPTNFVFTDAVYVFTSDRWDLYSTIQSSIHEIWARKYSGSLETRLRYSPSDCFGTFPFPERLWPEASPALATIGEQYHENRREFMIGIRLGLTDIYNLFHNHDLTTAIVAKVSGKPDESDAGYQSILGLRKLHRELDEAVLAAYGWTDLNLGHDFHEVETLPENDRVRYTISPDARKELLKRLLALNHQRAAEEKTKAPAKAEKAGKGKAGKGKKSTQEEPGLFG